MIDLYIGMPIFAVYGDDFIEPISKELYKISEKKSKYYLAVNDDGIEITVDIDDTFNNLDFCADIGTDYRVFTNEEDANRYFKYLNEHPYSERYLL